MDIDKFIKRDIFQDLKDHASKKEITLIVGPRQAGKTTLMSKLKEFLDSSGEKTLFLKMIKNIFFPMILLLISSIWSLARGKDMFLLTRFKEKITLVFF